MNSLHKLIFGIICTGFITIASIHGNPAIFIPAVVIMCIFLSNIGNGG